MEVIIEVVGPTKTYTTATPNTAMTPAMLAASQRASVPPELSGGECQFWGMTFCVEDIEVANKFQQPYAKTVRDAFQEGRKIYTLDHNALGMAVNMAFITPPRTSAKL